MSIGQLRCERRVVWHRTQRQKKPDLIALRMLRLLGLLREHVRDTENDALFEVLSLLVRCLEKNMASLESFVVGNVMSSIPGSCNRKLTRASTSCTNTCERHSTLL